jgi:hypothetical protein
MIAEKEGVLVTCSGCAMERKTKLTPKNEPRTPKGWKRTGEAFLCSQCWGKKYILRAITMPVASPDGDWKDLRADLKTMWVQTTQACNWLMTELYARDVRRNGEDKMPAMPVVYLYPEARRRFPDLPSVTVAGLEQTVKAKYRAKRYEVIWTCASALPTYRYPTPFPIPNQAWMALHDESGRPLVSARIGEKRWTMRLKGGARFRRQLAGFEQIANGAASQGEMAIFQSGKDLMCKLVAWLPRQSKTGERTGVLTARSTAESLLVALNQKDEKLWVYNADHLPRWASEHRKQLQRWSEDQKAEHRPVPPFAERRAHAARKYKQRMASACHQIAAMLVGYADRRRFAGIKWDDSDKSFAPEFPWFQLKELISEKADAAGIEFEHASSEAKEETPEPLAESEE